MARPTFIISTTRLKDLRLEAGLTQRQLAIRVNQALHPSSAISDDTLVTHYQRVERTGRTSRQRAQALANALGVDLGVLQGDPPEEEPVDIVDTVRRQLTSQLESGRNKVLANLYAKVVSDGEDLEYLAREISSDIEVAQLGGLQDEMARLCSLTGWSVGQLEQQAYVHGHWLVQARLPGSRQTSIVLGWHEVMRLVRDACQQGIDGSHDACVISLRKSALWYHVEARHARTSAFNCHVGFVRCHPDPQGVRWRNPNWKDKHWLEESLRLWSYESVNTVVDFDGLPRPRDLRRLRFLVEAFDCREPVQARQALARAELDAQREDTLARFAIEGQAHQAMLRWLSQAAYEGLVPHLKSSAPSDCWCIAARGSAVEVAPSNRLPYARYRKLQDTNGLLGTSFSICLVEEDADGTFHRVPWSKPSIEGCAQFMRDLLARGFEDADETKALALASVPLADGVKG